MSTAGIQVYLISGFLGSGKTTFLNHLIKETPPDLKLLILMNEFGEVSIDGALVENPELDMVEISRGSIFCACVKGDFIKALYQIAFVVQPEVLVIEASGVANPTDIGRDLFNPMYKGNFASLDKVCIVDAANFLEQYEIFTAVEKQVDASDKFIINKTDLVDRQIVDRIRELIANQNSNARFVETTFAEVRVADLFSGISVGGNEGAKELVQESTLMTNDQIEEVVDQILDDQAAQVTPPDHLISMACRWLTGSVNDFRHIADNLPSDVVRAKGFLFEEGQPYLYSHVGHSYEIVPFDSPRLSETFMNRVVFIRREFKEDDIRGMFAEKGLQLV